MGGPPCESLAAALEQDELSWVRSHGHTPAMIHVLPFVAYFLRPDAASPGAPVSDDEGAGHGHAGASPGPRHDADARRRDEGNAEGRRWVEGWAGAGRDAEP